MKGHSNLWIKVEQHKILRIEAAEKGQLIKDFTGEIIELGLMQYEKIKNKKVAKL